MSMCQIDLGISEVIALLALLVAGLSALYARWSWRESTRANEISLLAHKKEIYDAFFELKMHMTQKAEVAELAEVSKFFYPSRNASLYLPELSDKIKQFYEACFWVANIHHQTDGANQESMEKCKPHLAIVDELSSDLDASITSLMRRASA